MGSESPVCLNVQLTDTINKKGNVVIVSKECYIVYMYPI